MNLQTQNHHPHACESSDDHDHANAAHLAAIRQHIEESCPYANLLRDIQLDFDTTGALCLSGSVNSYYLRQVVVSFVVKAVKNIQVSDRLRVTDLPIS